MVKPRQREEGRGGEGELTKFREGLYVREGMHLRAGMYMRVRSRREALSGLFQVEGIRGGGE